MDIKYIVVHCSATRPSANVGRVEIDNWHRRRGWKGIGYHYVIKRDGTVEEGRKLTEIGAHVHGYNTVSWGVCMVGGLNEETGKPEDNFTDKQYHSLEDLLNTLHSLKPDAEIVGHRDLSPDVNGDGIIQKWEWVKDCPCFDVRDFIKDRGIVWAKKEVEKPIKKEVETTNNWPWSK